MFVFFLVAEAAEAVGEGAKGESSGDGGGAVIAAAGDASGDGADLHGVAAAGEATAVSGDASGAGADLRCDAPAGEVTEGASDAASAAAADLHGDVVAGETTEGESRAASEASSADSDSDASAAEGRSDDSVGAGAGSSDDAMVGEATEGKSSTSLESSRRKCWREKRRQAFTCELLPAKPAKSESPLPRPGAAGRLRDRRAEPAASASRGGGAARERARCLDPGTTAICKLGHSSSEALNDAGTEGAGTAVCRRVLPRGISKGPSMCRCTRCQG